MNIRKLVTASSLVLTLAASAMPRMASAQSIQHRRETENQWRNGTYIGAALGALGLATHKDTVTAIGAAVGGYSGYRWSQDISSRHRMEQERAMRFSHRYGGRRYSHRRWYRHRHY